MSKTNEPIPEEILGLLSFNCITMTEETEWNNLGGQNYLASVSWTATYAGEVKLMIDPDMQGPEVIFSRTGFDAATALENLYEAAYQQKWTFHRA